MTHRASPENPLPAAAGDGWAGWNSIFSGTLPRPPDVDNVCVSLSLLLSFLLPPLCSSSPFLYKHAAHQDGQQPHALTPVSQAQSPEGSRNYTHNCTIIRWVTSPTGPTRQISSQRTTVGARKGRFQLPAAILGATCQVERWHNFSQHPPSALSDQSCHSQGPRPL